MENFITIFIIRRGTARASDFFATMDDLGDLENPGSQRTDPSSDGAMNSQKLKLEEIISI